MDTSNKDNNIVGLLASGETRKENRAISLLYKKSFQGVKSYVLSNSGTTADADDVFQEAVAIVYKKVKEGQTEFSVGIGSFLFGVAKFVWLNQLRKTKRRSEDSLDDVYAKNLVEEEGEDYQSELIVLINEHVKSLSEDCKKVLTMFYYERKRMDEISLEMNYSSVQVAKNKKYKCLGHLRKIVNKDPQIKRIRE